MFTMYASIMVILVTLGELIWDSQAAECNKKLGMASGAIKDEQISASFFDGIYKPEHARFNGNSAWCVSAENGSGAFLEVDLGGIKRVTWLGIQGFGDGYVSNFTIQYKRSGTEKHWRNYVERLPFNTSKIMNFHGNIDNTTKRYRKFKGSRILRYLRFAVLGGVGERWCLKLELFGCEWKNKDGLVSYQAAQGNIRGINGTAVTMNDVTYDGSLEHYGRRIGALYGGLGQLTDGEVGGNAFWLDMGNGKSFEWIGWYDLNNLKPSILFEFDKPRRFHKIFFHGNNRPGNVRVFHNLMIAFSSDGVYYSRKFVFYPSYRVTQHRNRSVWIEVDLQNHVGKYLNCEFSYEGKWIVLSEVEFESEEYNEEQHTKLQTPTARDAKTRENTPSVRQIGRRPIETKTVLSLPAIIAMAVVGAALLLFTLVFIVWLTRMHQEGDDDEYPVRNVNRIVNSLKRGSMQRKGKPKKHSSSSESDDDIEELMLKKMNNGVPRDQPWYKSREY